jgi:hypothetical protein
VFAGEVSLIWFDGFIDGMVCTRTLACPMWNKQAVMQASLWRMKESIVSIII